MEFPWTPHTVTWQPKKDSRRGGPANDGKADSETEGGTLTLFIEEKSAAWVARTYGVEVDRRPYLVIGRVEDMEKMQKGDELTFGSQLMQIEYKPTIHDYGDGYTHGETMALGEKTGGRLV
jgi:hypothetical protein